ncbi:S8 family serine peptidase [Agaribacterium haliotis]|uniref:S8 family serine peptidase n=1 Tax=Agaribacterium haliotis TaxID=2013869 RepID=UPI000BB537CA|nr:S8 family serine peptidase [Agaribacterium haliotis]
MRKIIFLIQAWVLFVPALVFANSSPTPQLPPHVASEVAVYAIPSSLKNYSIKHYHRWAGISVVRVAPGKELAELNKLRARGLKAGLNLSYQKSYQPNDSYLNFQWHFDKVQASQAWEFSSGAGVDVAVLDTGFASGGDDSPNCVLSGANTYSGGFNTDDGDGHGTHVSGTIAQATNNGLGLAGLAFDACIMPVKVLSDSGSGTSASIADGLAFARIQQAKVINMSLGFNARFGIRSDPLIDPQLELAYAAGITVVVAAGNDGNKRNVSYPAIYPTTIAVGASDFRNRLTRYSNRGDGLDLVAPGGDTSRDDNGDGYVDGVLQETRINGSWGYYFFQGTSMASPHVAAAAAMLIAYGAASTPDEVKQRLQMSALDLGETGADSSYGYGLIQIGDALQPAPEPSPTPSNEPSPPAEPECIDNDGDGYCSVASGGEDCDDDASNVHPGANDTRGKRGRDGVDNDCDGVVDA